MSAYCTQAQLADRYGVETLKRHADYDNDGTADADTITRAITDASAIMDSYFAEIYVVPLVPIPDVVRSCCLSLTMCRLAHGRGSMTDDLKADCARWHDWLEDVASGKASIPAAPAPPESASARTVRYSFDDQLFGRDNFL